MKRRPHHQSNESAKDQGHCNPKSTASSAQRQRILEALRSGPKTSYCLRRLGCYQAPARIFELRKKGHNIETERVDLYDRDGYLHPRAARYRLIDEASK